MMGYLQEAYTDGLLEGEPIHEGFAEKLIFASGISHNIKIKILQVYYVFPDRFDYKLLKERFDISRRTALRWISKMNDLGMLEQALPRSGFSNRATYRFKDNW